MVLVPEGWLNFNGGGSDPSLCSEVDHPPVTLIPSAPELSCSADGSYVLTINVTGGVLPLIWAVSGGSVTATGDRSAAVDVSNLAYLGNHDEKVGSIAFFKPHMFTFASQVVTPAQHCINLAGDPNVYYREASVDVRLRPYDCLKRHITELADFGALTDNIQVDNTNDDNALDNPIGDDEADRSCVLANDWPFSEDGANGPSNAAHWSVDSTGCGLNDPGNVSVHVTASLAGKNGIHGAIHAGAPSYNKTMNVVVDQVAATADAPIRDTDFPSRVYLDVRTQVQVDAECCVVPAGSDVTVAVTDAEGTVAVIVIPVVEPA